MKRLHFIVTTFMAILGAAVLGMPKRATWADFVRDQVNKTGGRRFEHWIHMRVCFGEYDAVYSPADRARRRARCAKICGLCRYLYSFEQNPRCNPNYRRPPQQVLDTLEKQPYHPGQLTLQDGKQDVAHTNAWRW